MAFPSSPSIGQEYDESGVRFYWDGTVWRVKGHIGPAGPPGQVGAQGIQGVQGQSITGAQGIQGIQGQSITGAQGIQGIQGPSGSGVGDMLKSENLSGLANYTTARSNLGLGTAATVNTGTSGATIPLLNGVNTWSGTQTFTASPVISSNGPFLQLTDTDAASSKWRLISFTNALRLQRDGVGDNTWTTNLLTWDASNNLSVAAGTLSVGSNLVWHAGNFDPATKANLTGASFSGAVISTNGTGVSSLNINGDIVANRGDGTGVIYFGAVGNSRYLYYNGTSYVLPGAQLTINGSTAWHAGNFDPASYLRSDATDSASGALTFSGGLLISNGPGSIAGATFNNGWLRIGSSTLGWTFDNNEMYTAGACLIGSLAGSTMTFQNIPAFNGGTSGSTAPFTVDSTTLVTNLNADLLDGENLVDNAATANTVAGRDGSGDIYVRLIRETFADQSTISGGMVFRVNNSTDNYLRVCNSPTAIATYLGLGTASNVQHASLGIGTAASGTAGEIRATNNITAYYSDDRLKTRMYNIPNALDKIKTLNGFYFKPNETAEALGYSVEIQIGVSAQEVQTVLPEVVAPAPINDKYLTVRYEKLIPLLIEAIKEQQLQIDELKQLSSGL